MAAIYTDNDVSLRTGELLEQLGHSVVTTRGRQRAGASDAEQWTVSVLNRWIFLSHNRRDYVLLQDAWERWSALWQNQPAHAGVLIIPQAWLPDRASAEVDRFIAAGTEFSNRLYEASATGVWRRWIPADT